MAETTYKDAAAAGFTTLACQFATCDFTGNFWFAGNAFHTLLDYMVLANVKDTNGVVRTAYSLYTKLLPQSDWWHDDYAWWGNALLIALDNRVQLGYGDPSNDPLFKQIAQSIVDCFDNSLKEPGDWGIYNFGSTNPDAKDHAAGSSNFAGGVYNIRPDSEMTGIMQGRNSVTNEGFWLLSLGLAGRNPTGSRYQRKALDMMAWYKQWFTYVPPKGGNGLFNADGLVLERPTGNSTYPQWYWTGDQGLFAHAVYSSATDGNLAISIIKKTIDKMKDSNGVLHEDWSFTTNGLNDYNIDYATGKGIFMRSLTQVGLPWGMSFKDFITTNAGYIWTNQNTATCNGSSGPQFTLNWDRVPGPNYEPDILTLWDGSHQDLCDLIMQGSGQDALNAAMRVAPDGVIKS